MTSIIVRAFFMICSLKNYISFNKDELRHKTSFNGVIIKCYLMSFTISLHATINAKWGTNARQNNNYNYNVQWFSVGSCNIIIVFLLLYIDFVPSEHVNAVLVVRINFKGSTNVLCDFYYAIDITAVYAEIFSRAYALENQQQCL